MFVDCSFSITLHFMIFCPYHKLIFIIIFALRKGPRLIIRSCAFRMPPWSHIGFFYNWIPEIAAQLRKQTHPLDLPCRRSPGKSRLVVPGSAAGIRCRQWQPPGDRRTVWNQFPEDHLRLLYRWQGCTTRYAKWLRPADRRAFHYLHPLSDVFSSFSNAFVTH